MRHGSVGARRVLRRLVVPAALAALALVAGGPAAAHDHPPRPFIVQAPASTNVNSGGPGASWQLVNSLVTGNPHTDIDFFMKGGEIFASVGTLAIGANSGGQSIFRLTQGGVVTPNTLQFVASHPSASCVSDPAAALGLQHDVEATPKGPLLLNTPNPFADTRDAQLLLDATDNEGRCHDSTQFGLNPTDPQGGLEIIDITDVAHPKEIGLTSHIGEAHTVNVDPKRPHIAFAVTSDFVSVTCDADDTSCTRSNETTDPTSAARFNLDGFELVDLRSCMNFSPLTSVDVKRMTCRPQVYRYRWPSALLGMGHTTDSLAGCHELEIYPDDRLVCAAVNATMVFDLKGAFNDNGTPTNYLDDTPNGTPLPCRLRPSATPPGTFPTGAMVTDCVFDATGQELTIPRWLSIGAPSLTGVTFLGSVIHQGRVGNTPPPYPAPDDVEVSHEAEFTASRKFILTTDERGGGVLPPGAACPTSPADNSTGNGGIHAYKATQLLPASPSGPDTQAKDTAWTSYATKPGGGKAIYRAPIRTQPQGSLCTSHVFHQIPGQNRIFMGWYTQGTQVVDFVEHPDGTFEFKEAGWFIPQNANTWVSAVFKMQRNPDGTFTYWGATGDFNLGTAGRNAVDVYRVTLPAPAGAPTAVKLVGFTARPAAGAVELRWRTAQETRLLGFNVYRSGAGRTIKLNRALIVAKAGRLTGAQYRLVDRRPRAHAAYRYRLQAVTASGSRYWLATTVVDHH